MINRSITRLTALGVVLFLWAACLGLWAGPAAADTPPASSRTPDSIDFGTQQAGTTGAPRTIIVTAVSDGFAQVCDPTQIPKCWEEEAPTRISKLTMGGTDAAAFKVSGQSCTGRDLWQGDTCSVDVTFSPAAVGNVSYSATLTIDSNSSWSAGNQVQLSGNTLPPPDCSHNGNGTKIAYSGYDGNDYEIYTIEASGGTPCQVTDNSTADRVPSLSSDGTKIAYESYDGNDYEIYTIEAGGGTPFQLTNNTTGDFSPSLSSDGTKIAYESYDGQDLDIYTIEAGGGTPFLLTNNTTRDTSPSYSPDGTKIAYQGCPAFTLMPVGSSPCDIYTIDAGGGTPFQLTHNSYSLESYPSYSPDGKMIAYQGCPDSPATPVGSPSLCEIYTISAESVSPAFPVTNNTTYDTSPSYSPDGTKIAYQGHDGNDYEIYTIDSGGGAPFNVTNNTTDDSLPSYPQPSAPPDTRAPTVTTTVPTSNATGVAPGVNVTATFSEAMMSSSINGTTFKLFKGTTAIGAVVSYDPATKKATLNPNTNLQRGAKYKAVVNEGAKDLAGNALDQDSATTGSQAKQWVFTVRR